MRARGRRSRRLCMSSSTCGRWRIERRRGRSQGRARCSRLWIHNNLGITTIRFSFVNVVLKKRTALTMLMSNINQALQPFLRHQREGATSKLDAIDILAPVAEKLVEVCLGDWSVVWPADFSETYSARFGRERVGRKEGEGVSGFVCFRCRGGGEGASSAGGCGCAEGRWETKAREERHFSLRQTERVGCC